MGRMNVKPYLMIDLEAIDDGFLTTVSPKALTLYILLRRFVWRSTKTSLGRATYGSGWLVCLMSLRALAELLELKERQVRNLFKEIEQAGWVRPVLWGKKKIHVLGKLVKDEWETREAYWMDSRLGENAGSPPAKPKIIYTGKKLPVSEDPDCKILHTKSVKNKIKVQRDSEDEFFDEGDGIENALHTKKLKEKYVPCLSRSDRSARAINARGFSRIPSSWKKEKTKGTTPLSSKKVTAHTLKALCLKYSAAADLPPPAISAREMKHLADLAKMWGKDSEKYLKIAFSKWRILRAKFNIHSQVPDIKSIYTFREQIVILTSQWESVCNASNKNESDEEDEGW